MFISKLVSEEFGIIIIIVSNWPRVEKELKWW